MFNLFKIGTLLKFFWKRGNSSKLVIKNPREKVIAVEGDNNTAQMAEGNIYNNYESSTTAVDDSESWDNVQNGFSSEKGKWIVDYTNDSRAQAHMKENRRGPKKQLIKNFDKVRIPSKDPRAKDFIILKKKALESLDSFIDNRDETVFLKAWASYREDIISLRKL